MTQQKMITIRVSEKFRDILNRVAKQSNVTANQFCIDALCEVLADHLGEHSEDLAAIARAEIVETIA